jgi:hypothetical protein
MNMEMIALRSRSAPLIARVFAEPWDKNSNFGDCWKCGSQKKSRKRRSGDFFQALYRVNGAIVVHFIADLHTQNDGE